MWARKVDKEGDLRECSVSTENDLPNGFMYYVWSGSHGSFGKVKDFKFCGPSGKVFDNGIRYIGYRFHGDWKGHFINVSCSGSVVKVYEVNGDWSKTNSYGEQNRSNGDYFMGQHENGIYHGQATYEWPDGSKYVGLFDNGAPGGQGVRTWKNGLKREGVWTDYNSLTGTESKDGVLRYEGTWDKSGRLNGVGFLYDDMDNKRKAEFKKGKMIKYLD